MPEGSESNSNFKSCKPYCTIIIGLSCSGWDQNDAMLRILLTRNMCFSQKSWMKTSLGWSENTGVKLEVVFQN